MNKLKRYVKQNNDFYKAFGQEELNLNNAGDRRKIMDRLVTQLSPEFLTCDGELSRTEVDRRYRFLRRVAAQLIQLDPSVKFYEFA